MQSKPVPSAAPVLSLKSLRYDFRNKGSLNKRDYSGIKPVQIKYRHKHQFRGNEVNSEIVSQRVARIPWHKNRPLSAACNDYAVGGLFDAS